LFVSLLTLYVAASPFQVDPRLDLQLTVTSFMLSAGPRFLEVPSVEAPALSPPPLSLLPAIDRSVVGNNSGSASSWSDKMLYAQLALPFVATLVDNLVSGGPGKLNRFATESLVLLEAAAMTSMLTVATKTMVRRPRPYMFDPETDEERRNSHGAHESFFSGHTAMAFSMATAYSYMYQKKHPDSPAVIPIWVSSHLVASGIGLLRVQGGKHFWTDVATGAAVGSAVGLLVPWLHQRGGKDDGHIGLDNVRIVPQASSEYFGLSALWYF
jgi:membrane-associated phospholipid phosphatase